MLVARRKRPVILERVGACFPGSSALKANLVALVIWPARMVIAVTIVRSADATTFRLQQGLSQGNSRDDPWLLGLDVDSLSGFRMGTPVPVDPDAGRREELIRLYFRLSAKV